MPEAIGLVLLSPAELGAVEGIAGLGSLAGTTIAGVPLATVVGTAAIIGASIGLQYALKPGLPPVASGTQPLQQAIPPRIRGYGTNRLAGYYMVFEAALGASFDVMALHSGRISSVSFLYLHDDFVQVSPGIGLGGVGVVNASFADGRYGGDKIHIELKLGTNSQPVSSLMSGDPPMAAIWDPSHQGNGIAYAVLNCTGCNDVPTFTKIYPHQLPVLSVVADCSPVWDPRDPAQSAADESTWIISHNPVLQLIDYLTRADGGMGLDFDIVIGPNLAAWMVEADLCETIVPLDTLGNVGPLYASDGWFQFDNKPEDIIGGILSTCDGWLAESGDGTLSLTVGVYRAPIDPPITQNHIMGFALAMGQADESSINQLDISFTDSGQNFVEVQPPPFRDEESISRTGIVRSQSLDLKWVQNLGQANRLAIRAMARLNPLLSGTFTTTLYGLRYLGKRWIALQYPFVSGLQSAIVEIQGADVDLMGGTITFTFLLVVPDALEAFDPTSVVPPAPIPPVPNVSTTLDFSNTPGSQYVALLEDI